MEGNMPTITTNDGVQMHYKHMGTGSKTVVLVHGWQVSGSVWNIVVDELAAMYQLIVVDLRGAGASNDALGPYIVERYSEDILNLVETLELERFVLVGHSMGGAIAQRFATDHSDLLAGLVLIASVPASGLPLPPEAQALFRSTAGSRAQTEAFWQTTLANPLPPAIFNMLVDSSMTVRPQACLAAFDSWRQLNFAHEVGHISAPTLVLAPAVDTPMTPDFLYEKVAALISNSRFVIIDNTSHYPQLEQPQQLVRLLVQFIDELA
jgi:pimeloyl-ACP methyl ester carboxylesterase